jgi:hypothetical protein
MAEIISFAERRNARLRDKLMTFARKGEAIIIDTGKGPIRGEAAASLLNSWGEKVALSYGEIRGVRPGITPQLSTISDHGDFIVPAGLAAPALPTRILAFSRPGRRR